MKNYTNNQSGFLSIMAGIVGLIVVSGAAYFVVQNRTVIEDPVAPTVAEEPATETDAEVEVTSAETRPGYTTRRRVEVLKSNDQGDPNANRYDIPVEGEVSEEVVIESAVQGDPDANRYDFGTTGEANAEANEAQAAESSNGLDDNCDSPTGSDADCEALDSDDDGDGIPTLEAGSESNPMYEDEATKAQNPMYEEN